MKSYKSKEIFKTILILFLSSFFLPNKFNAQSKTFKENSFKIVKTAEITDISIYEKALNVPDIESFRFKTKRNTLVFDNGVTVELLSAQELFIKGETIEPSAYSDTRDKIYVQPIFHLTDKGSLITMYTKILK